MLAFAKENQDISIVFRPHPALVTMLNNLNEDTRNIFQQFVAEWSSLTNVTLSTSTTYEGYFKVSDLSISDGMSRLLEYQTKKTDHIHREKRS